MSSEPKIITIFGSYGVGNFGDELMLRELVAHLMPNSIRIVAYNLAPLWIEREFEGKVQIVRVSKRGSIRTRLETSTQLTKAILRSDVVIYGGGTFLFDNAPRSYKNLLGVLRVTAICRLLAKRLCLIGIGIGELDTVLGRQITKIILKSAHLITVREKESLNDTRELVGRYTRNKILRSADLAFLSNDLRTLEKDNPGQNGEFTIAVCGTEFDYLSKVAKSEEELSSLLAPALDQMVECGIRIRFVPMQTSSIRDDNSFHRKVQDKMRNAHFTEIVQVNDEYSTIYRELEKADLVVGMRLHSLVTAISVGTPILGLALLNKVRRFMKECKLSNYTLEAKDILDAQTIRRMLTLVVEDIRESRYPSIENIVSSQSTLARVNISALKDFI
jgi:polysaccharide pyruvyl transferase WcaK-like protein